MTQCPVLLEPRSWFHHWENSDILFVFVLLSISKVVFVNWILFFIAGKKWLLLLLSWFHSSKKMRTSKKGNGWLCAYLYHTSKILQLYSYERTSLEFRWYYGLSFEYSGALKSGYFQILNCLIFVRFSNGPDSEWFI